MGMESVFRVSLVLDLIDKMSSGVEQVTKNTTSQFDKLDKTFGTLQKAGTVMGGVGTAITGTCLGAATATFDTQDALGELSSLGIENLSALESAAKSFSDTWAGTTKADFLSASYDIKSGIASLTDEGVAQYTELAGLTAKATKATTADMTSLFATGYGIYKGFYSDMSDMEFGEMFSAGIATAVKNYKTSGTQMADAIKTIGASATNAQVPMEEQLAILGQLQATMSGSEAGTKYKAFINSAASAGEKLGLSFMDNNNQLLSMPEIMDTLRDKYGDTIDAMEKQQLKEAFGTDEAIALIDLLYNNTDQLRTGIEDLQDSMSKGTDITQEMAEAINNTPAQKFQQIKQQIHNVTEELGAGLLPGINASLTGVSNMIQAGSDWVAANQETVSTVMQIVTMLGIFLIIAGAGIALMGTLGKVFLTAKNAIGIVKTAMGLLNSTFLSSPIFWVIAGIAALIAVFQLCGGDVTKLGELFGTAFTAIGDIVTSVLDMVVQKLPEMLQFGVNIVLFLVQGIAQMLPGLLSAGISLLVTLVQGIAQNLPVIANAGIQLILVLLQGILNAAPQLLSAVLQLIPVIGSAIISAAPSLISGGIQIIGAILNGIITAVPAILGMIPELFGMIVDSVTSIDWIGVGKNLISGIKDGFIDGFSSLVDSAKGLWDDFTGWLFGEGDSKEMETALNAASAESGTTAPIMTATPLVDYDTASMEQKGTAAIDALTAGINTGMSDAEAQVSKSTEELLSAFQIDLPEAETTGADLMGDLMAGLETGAVDATAAAGTAAQDIMSAFNMDTSGASIAGTDLMSGITDSITAGTIDAQAVASQSAADISSAFGNIDTAGGGVESSISEMQSAVDTGMNSIVSSTQAGGSQIAAAWTSAMETAKFAVVSGMNSIQIAAASKAQSIATTIKSAFSNIRVTVPAPTLPHVSVSYSTVGSGNATAQVPNFSVSYHAEGGIMSGATLMGFDSSGTAHIGGEAGDEALLPLDTFWSKLKQFTVEAVTGKKKESSGNSGSSKKQSSGKGNIYIQKLIIQPNMEDMDSLKKLQELIDEIDGNTPVPA